MGKWPVAMAELAVDKLAATLLMPVGSRRALNDPPDELWTRLNIEFYSVPADGALKIPVLQHALYKLVT